MSYASPTPGTDHPRRARSAPAVWLLLGVLVPGVAHADGSLNVFDDLFRWFIYLVLIVVVIVLLVLYLSLRGVKKPPDDEGS